MVVSKSALSDKDGNFLRSFSSMRLLKEGMEPFIDTGSSEYVEDIIDSARKESGLSGREICGHCTTHNALPCFSGNKICHYDKFGDCLFHDKNDPLKTSRNCPNGICHRIFQIVKRRHRYHLPNFRNTDARKWFSNPFEIMKCFISTDGYQDTETVGDTDCAGLLSIVINCKPFQSMVDADLADQDNPFVKMRRVRNRVQHSDGKVISDRDFQEQVELSLSILQDSKFLAHDVDAQEAAEKIEEIAESSVHVFCGDEVQQQNTESDSSDNSCEHSTLRGEFFHRCIELALETLVILHRDHGAGKSTMTPVFKESNSQQNQEGTVVDNNGDQVRKKRKPTIVIVFSVKKKDGENATQSMSRGLCDKRKVYCETDRKEFGVQTDTSQCQCPLTAGNNCSVKKKDGENATQSMSRGLCNKRKVYCETDRKEFGVQTDTSQCQCPLTAVNKC